MWAARIARSDMGGGLHTCWARAAMRGGAFTTIGNIFIRARNCTRKKGFNFGVFIDVLLRRGRRNCICSRTRGPKSAIKKWRSTHGKRLGSPTASEAEVSPIACVQGGCEEASRPRAMLFPRRDPPSFVWGVLANLISRSGRDMDWFRAAMAIIHLCIWVRSLSFPALWAQEQVPSKGAKIRPLTSHRSNKSSADWYAVAEKPNVASVATPGG